MYARIFRTFTHNLGLFYAFLHFLLIFGKCRMLKSDNFPPSVPSEDNPVTKRRLYAKYLPASHWFCLYTVLAGVDNCRFTSSLPDRVRNARVAQLNYAIGENPPILHQIGLRVNTQTVWIKEGD